MFEACPPRKERRVDPRLARRNVFRELTFLRSSLSFPPIANVTRAEATTASMLSMLFQQFPGFTEVRMVEAKPGIAFVEFDSDTRSAVALSGLQGFKINPTHSMTLSYAKK